MKSMYLSVYIFAFTILSLPVAVEAHPFHWATQSIGFTNGFFHQLTDFDHILLLLAIGIGFSKPGIKAQASLISVFAMTMLSGAALPFLSFDFNGIQYAQEIGALSSLLILALGCKALLLSKRMFILGAFALYHGHSHAYDMLLDTDATSFTLGYLISTIALILTGIILKGLLNRYIHDVHYFEQYV